MTDYHNASLESQLDGEYAAGAYGPGTTSGLQLGIALRPSFGLNSVYLGGDTAHGDPIFNPWTNPQGRIAALRVSEVKSPAKIIVFAPTRATVPPANPGTSVTLGYMVLSPPYANFNRDTQTALLPEWSFDATGQIVFNGMAAAAGVPSDRLGQGKVPVSHLDGSVGIDLWESMGPSATNPKTQMSRWSPFAVGDN